MEEVNAVFFILLPVVAFLYATVGHGGASGYLALMALFSISTPTMRTSALVLNILVSLVAFLHYRRSSPMPWKLFVPLVLFSMPAAWFGGSMEADPLVYKRILGLILLIPIARFLGFLPESNQSLKPPLMYWIPVIGLAIGFLSGLIGIGGGILLSPLLLMLGWTDVKQSATISALFITVNSLAGLSGNFDTSVFMASKVPEMVLLAFAGGFAGAYFGANRFNTKLLKRTLAVVLIIASAKLMTT